MHCHNCANVEQFVLLLDCSVRYRPPARFVAPAWSLALQCARCASTDVHGSPAHVLARYLRRDVA